MANHETVVMLKQRSIQMKKDIIELVHLGQPGHLGGSLSCADVVCALYFYKMRLDPANPKWDGRDIFVLSKGHSSLAQYAALLQLGIVDRKEMKDIKRIGAVLQCHPDMTKTPGIEVNTVSLGQGLSIAVGIALGSRLNHSNRKVYSVIGDGESDAGQIWEAMNAAKVHGLDNLVAIMDHNKLKASGKIREVYDTGNLSAKATAFGWVVLDIDGHDMAQIVDALDFADTVKNTPVMIIAHTAKAKGVSFAENLQPFHHCALSDEQYRIALEDVSKEN